MPTVDIEVEMGEAWKRKLREIAVMGADLKVGFLGGDSYPDGTSVAYVAYINEYGKGHNPERPFMKETTKDYMSRWVEIIENNVNDKFDQANVMRAFEMAGQDAEGLIREQIKTWPTNSPRPNAFATVWRKDQRGQSGRGTVAVDPEQVLIDTGVMINAVRHEVTRS